MDLKCNNIFTLYLVNLYNSLFEQLIVLDCKCYDIYRCSDCDFTSESSDEGKAKRPKLEKRARCKFENYVFLGKNPYFCCILLPDDIGVAHLKFPVMIGSSVDLKIRGNHVRDSDRHLIGSIITDTGVKIVANFLTNNLKNGYSYLNTKTKEYEFRFNISNEGETLKFIYKNGNFDADIINDIEAANAKRTMVFIGKSQFTRKVTDEDEIFSFIEGCVPFDPEFAKGVTKEDYMEYIATVIANPVPLDSLKNKIILTAPIILKNMYEYIIFNYDRQQIAASMGNLFNSGNGYMALTSKKHVKASTEYTKSVYLSVEGEKLDQIAYNVSVIKRYVTTQTTMSKALLYPEDGRHYLCPLAIKEMVGAGETLHFASSCISSPPIKRLKYLNIVINTILKSSQKYLKAAKQTDKRYILVIESFVTNIRVAREFIYILKNKLEFLFLKTIGDKYINIQYSGNIIMKFSNRYQKFLAPSESEFYPNPFENESPFLDISWFGYKLPFNFIQAPPAKLTVSISNIKGSVCELEPGLMSLMFLHTIGYNSAILHNSQCCGGKISKISFFDETPMDFVSGVDKFGYLNLAILPNEPKRVLEIDWSKKPKGYFTGSSIANIWKRESIIEIGTKFQNFIGQKLAATLNDVETGCRIADAGEFPKYQIGNLMKFAGPVVRLDSNLIHENQFYLWVALGDVGGGTNEDGIVLDSKFCKEGPMHINAATFNVKFVGDKNADRTYIPINKQFGELLVFGVVITKHDLQKHCSKNITVHKIAIGATKLYWIYVVDQTQTNKTICSYYNKKNGNVFTHYRYLRSIGIGSKIANLHGQKNVVSKLEDLSRLKFWMRDGRCVHPQMIMSSSSIIGRNVASQIAEMITSDYLALNEYGMFCAPIAVNLHHIDPGVKMKIGQPKIDIMTSENGFLANDTSNLLPMMEMQTSNNAKKRFDFLLELSKLSGINIDFLNEEAINLVDPEASEKE